MIVGLSFLQSKIIKTSFTKFPGMKGKRYEAIAFAKEIFIMMMPPAIPQANAIIVESKAATEIKSHWTATLLFVLERVKRKKSPPIIAAKR